MIKRLIPTPALLLLLCFLSCKKEKENISYTGMYFYPVDPNISLFSSFQNGILSDVKGTSFFYSKTLQSKENYLENRLTFDFNTHLVSQTPVFDVNKPEKIIGLVAIDPDRYIGRITDFSRDTLINGFPRHKEFIVLVDGKGNKLKEYQLKLDFSGLRYINITPLQNGTCLVTSLTNYFDVNLYCFNKDLNLLWVKQKTGVGQSGFYPNVLSNTSSFYAMHYSVNPYAGYSVYNYGYGGTLLNKYVNPVTTQTAIEILPVPGGFSVFGKSYDLLYGDRFFLSRFEANCKLISTKYMDKQQFLKNAEVLDLSTNGLNITSFSNFIVKGNEFYFILSVLEKSGNYTNIKNKFVRVNEDFEIEKIETIETSTLNTDSYKYLIEKGDHFVSVTLTKWNSKTGLSFIETDMDGKIIK